MRILIFVLTLSVFSCSGFPVYDYELPITEEALNASLAKINSWSWGPNLYGIVRSHVVRVYMRNNDAYRLHLQLNLRETVCPKASGRDPFTCDFKIGPYVRTAFCRSSVDVSGELISDVMVECHLGGFSSESMSSEEMLYMPMMNPSRRGNSRREEDTFAPEAFPLRGRGGSRGGRFNDDKIE